MIKIKNVKVYGLEESILRSGFPMQVGEPFSIDEVNVNEKDLRRISKLAKVKTGTGHDNALKGIIVQFDLQYPEYFSPQLQRYSWIDIISSQSKMFKLASRELTVDDFTEDTCTCNISQINSLIKAYNDSKGDVKKALFKKIISNLPSGYLKWMGISTNYLQLKTIYFQRKQHKLNEWKEFCKWIEQLPMFKKLVLRE